MSRIGIDATPLQKLNGGISYYLYYLLDELIKIRSNDTFYLFVERETKELQLFKAYPNVRIYPIKYYSLGHSFWAQTLLSYACIKTKIDVFWGPTQSIPLIKRPSMKTVLTQHDFVYRLHPETVPWVSRLYFQLFSRFMISQANVITAVSNGTGEKMEKFYGRKADCIITPPLKKSAYFRSDIQCHLQALSLKNKQYLVFVGTLEPRKNLERLLAVYLQVLSTSPDEVLPLVIIGSGGWKNKKLKALLEEKLFPDHIRALGYVTDEMQANILSGARYCMLMSKYEGYGMPLAESRMCGTAVICTDQLELRQAAENDGVFLDANWEETIRPYFLAKAAISLVKCPNYASNQEKAKQLESLCF